MKSAWNKNYRTINGPLTKRVRAPPPSAKIDLLSPVENADDFSETPTLVLELDDPLDPGKHLLAVQTVTRLCTLGFCYKSEGRIVVDGLTSKTGIPHDLADLVELLRNHRVSTQTIGVTFENKFLSLPEQDFSR